MDGEQVARSSGVGFRSERGPVLIAVMLSTALVAIDATVIATAVPSVVTDLGGFAEFPCLVAGFALAALTLGWPISASQAGPLYLRIGIRSTALVGVAVVLLGSALLLLLDGSSSVLLVGGTAFVIGLGMGFTAAPTLIAAQSAVRWTERGVVTGLDTFARSAGSAIGIAVFGAVVNATLRGQEVGGDGVSPAALTTAVHHVFVGTVVLSVALLAAVLLMPRDRTRSRATEDIDEVAAH